MATLGRGWLLVNFQGGVGGGPGMGFLLTFPVIIGSLIGGYIYEFNPTAPWLLLGAAMAGNALIAGLLLRPGKDEP